MELTQLHQQLINGFQRGFPLSETPYADIARELNVKESHVLKAMSELQDANILSRIGPVFDHKKAGASTLAALAVAPSQLEKIAGIVNQFEQVNHNYAREHDYNLWFVVTAKDSAALAKTLNEIEEMTGLTVLDLPMEASFHIDLAFDIDFAQNTVQHSVNHSKREATPCYQVQ